MTANVKANHLILCQVVMTKSGGGSTESQYSSKSTNTRYIFTLVKVEVTQ